MNSKEYTLPNGKKAVFEYDMFGIGMISLECMDELMAMIADRPQGKWLLSDLQSQVDNDNGNYAYVCTNCNHTDIHAKTQKVPYCWWCGARMKGTDDE